MTVTLFLVPISHFPLAQALIRDNWSWSVTGAVDSHDPGDTVAQINRKAVVYRMCSHHFWSTLTDLAPKGDETRFSYCAEQLIPDIQLGYSASVLAAL